MAAPVPTTILLALDLGTKTGFCVGPHPGALLSGVWDMRPDRFDGGGMRFVKFRAKLDEMHAALTVERVYYEEVRAHKGVSAAHIYGGLMAVLQAWCEERKIPYAGVPVGHIKKAMTGKGNADKSLVIECVRLEGFAPADDNEADAIALWLHKYRSGD